MASPVEYSDVITEKRLRPGMTWPLGTLIIRGRTGPCLRDGALIMVTVILLREQAKGD